VSQNLKDSACSAIGGFRRARIQNGLLIGQIGLSLVLMVGAGLLFQNFVRLNTTEPGFEPDGLAVLPLTLDREKYTRDLKSTLAQQLIENIEAIPGVRRAAVSVTYPFEYLRGSSCCWFTGGFRTDDGVDHDDIRVVITPISEGYFQVLGANIRGREFVRGDEDHEVRPAVISQSMADMFFPGIEPLGREFYQGDVGYSVVGVVAGVRHWGLEGGVAFEEMYLPWSAAGSYFSRLRLLVRSEGDPAELSYAFREAVWSVDPDLPVPEVIPMRSRVSRSLAGPRLLSALLILFGTLATLLATGGVYGSVLYQVRQRNREMGLRLALGAARSRILGTVVGRGVLLTVFGMAIGTAVALVVQRALGSMVFGILEMRFLTLLGAALLVGSGTVVASYTAARKALVTDPASALRED
jgi:predicted permease